MDTSTPPRVCADVSDRSATSSAKGNLTGIARKIKDSCADIYNLSQRWDTLRANGAVLLNRIAGAKLKSLQAKEDEASDETEASDEKLLELCSLLLDVWTEMEQQVTKMTAIVNNLSAVVDLHNTSSSLRVDEVPFTTWPVERFYDTACEIAVAFAKELGIKKCIVEEVAMQGDEKTLSFYVTAWTYQVYIDAETELSLEALVREVGLK
ncbi:cyclin-dependent kinase 2-interacting protein-like isoform X2 [Dermacentor variabilis]|uniref:cyclin-dependent kinase 2-interacting protein-like isoform X2 n=1 Tax=Dermacentor variabilis TaxID=34621 RepID=UPI003F5C8B0B